MLLIKIKWEWISPKNYYFWIKICYIKNSSSDHAQIIQEFFGSFDIISQSEKIKDIYSRLINVILDSLLSDKKQDGSEYIKEIKIYDSNSTQNLNESNLENLKSII